MRLAVLGATGQTGQQLVTQALQQGHSVTAIVRNLTKLTVEHQNLKVVEGNIFSEDSLSPHFKGQDAVISCLGFRLSVFTSVSGFSDSMKATVNAMKQAKVNRIIAMSSWFSEPNSSTNAGYMVRFLILPMIRSLMNNMYEMETVLSKTEDINWTVVRPSGLTNEPATAKEFLTHEGYFVPYPSEGRLETSISRADVARFMLSLLNSSAWDRKGVSMTTK
nr:PREDICTED: uncharacterized protein At2g34460, chloroplastic-like [Lepisosteus oculatus]